MEGLVVDLDVDGALSRRSVGILDAMEVVFACPFPDHKSFTIIASEDDMMF